MTLNLNNLAPAKGSRRPRKRLGRGWGSGKGKYCGRGMKGQKARSGVSGLKKLGMKRLVLSMPKARGFKSPYKKAEIVKLGELASLFATSEEKEVTMDSLIKLGLISRTAKRAKILNEGDINEAMIVKGVKVSKGAQEKIEKVGGRVDV